MNIAMRVFSIAHEYRPMGKGMLFHVPPAQLVNT